MGEMSEILAEVLANYLDSLLSGDASLEDCLSRFPQYEHELVKLLCLVRAIMSVRLSPPRSRFVEDTSEWLVSQLPDRNST
jgi:hypothetical protein